MSNMLKGKAQVLKRPKLPIEGHFCSYHHRVCMQNRLEGYDYCIRHILEDRNSPFKQCNYTSSRSSKRCPNPAPKADKKDGYCAEHSRKATLLRQRANRKKRPPETPETILEDLEHYGTRPLTNEQGVAIKRQRMAVDSIANRVLDYASSSDSEADQTQVNQAWRADQDSDAESVDSEQEDLLKHAGVYTAEEVALITRDKLIRLQSLYIEQFRRLQHVLKEKRRGFLQAVKREAEKAGSVDESQYDAEQHEKYEELMATKRYHKRHGKEALLHRQSKERRIAVSEGVNYHPPAYPLCSFMEAEATCSERVVPLSKFCQNHILTDPNQVLYQCCDFGHGRCQCPVAQTACEVPRCWFHSQLETPATECQETGDEDLLRDESEIMDESSVLSNPATQSVEIETSTEVSMDQGSSEVTETHETVPQPPKQLNEEPLGIVP